MNTNADQQFIAAHFRNSDDAAEAVRALKDAGFRSNQIGCSCDADFAEGDISGTSRANIEDRSIEDKSVDRDRYDTTGYAGDRHEGFWGKMRGFFSGEEGYEDRDTGAGDGRYNEGVRVGPTLRIPDRYNSRLDAGEAIVTVHDSSRVSEAESILTRFGGTIDREFGKDAYAYSDVDGNIDTDVTVDLDKGVDRGIEHEGRRISLLSEVLRVNKQRVQTGEVRLRKEVRTENQTIEVPVQREELVIERLEGDQRLTTDVGSRTIGEGEEIRVPLSEERVDVQKSPVVREEVRVGKRNIEDTQHVSEDVRHEELNVDDSSGRVVGDLKKDSVSDDLRKDKKRKIA